MCAQRILLFTSASRLVVVGNKFGIIYSEQSSDENDGDTKQTDIEQKNSRAHTSIAYCCKFSKSYLLFVTYTRLFSIKRTKKNRSKKKQQLLFLIPLLGIVERNFYYWLICSHLHTQTSSSALLKRKISSDCTRDWVK